MVVVVGFVQHEGFCPGHPAADQQRAAEGFMLVDAARTVGAVPEDAGCIAAPGIAAVGEKLFVAAPARNGLDGCNYKSGSGFDMRGKKFGYQVGAEKVLAVELKVFP